MHTKKFLPLTVLLILSLSLVSVAARADYGSWELLRPGTLDLYNSAIININILSDTLLYAASLNQSGPVTIDVAHYSTDGGYSWSPWRSYTGTDFCSSFGMIHMMLDLHFFDELHGIMGGFGAKDWCFEMLPEPLCMACVFMNGTVIYYTEDGGVSWEEAQIQDHPVNGSFTAVQMIDDTYGYAVGQYATFLQTADGGYSWQYLGNPAPDYDPWDVNIQSVHFLDRQTGYIAFGEYEENALKLDEAVAATMSAQDVIDWMLHKERLLKNPLYRARYYRSLPDPGGSKMFYGRVMKTTDGGLSWTTLYDDPQRGFYKVYFLNENRGFAVGESFRQQIAPPFLVLETFDGGLTWAETPLPDWTTIPGITGEYAVKDISFYSERMGFMIAAAPFPSNLDKFLIFYTFDGGLTWQLDPLMDNYDPLDLKFYGRDAWLVGQAFITAKYTGVNSTPIADAGADQEVALGSLVTLDGSGSYDPDGDELVFLWSQTDGEPLGLSSYTEETATFTAEQLGEFTFTLTVSDAELTGAPDEVTIVVVEADDDTIDDDAIDDDSAPDDDDDDVSTDDDSADGGDDDDDGCGC